AASKTRKDRQRERRRKRSESAGRLFEQALVELTDDGGPPEGAGATEQPDPPPPSTPAPVTPPSTPPSYETEEAEVGVSAFFSLEERAIEPGVERESPSEGSEGSEASLEYEPLISDSDEQLHSDPPADRDEVVTTGAAITEDISVAEPRDAEDSTVRGGLNALDDFGVDMALVSEVTPPPSPETDVGVLSPDREPVADGPLDLPAGWGPVDEGVAPGAEEVALDPGAEDPFVPTPGEVDVSLPPWDDAAEPAADQAAAEEAGAEDAAEDAAAQDEPSFTEESEDMMYIVLEDTHDFPDLEPDNMPTPPDEPPEFPQETTPTAEDSESSGGHLAVKEGMAELRAGRRDEAIALFGRALRIDPDDAMAAAYLNLAQELMLRDTLPDASLTSVPRLRVGREILLTLDVSPELGAVLALVDGVSDLETFETLLPHLDRPTLYGLLAEAHEQGLIEL
ncbi:MAG: hypothetical protein QGH45_25200, partial [Myxococcota bacterium]|nr:hypothetical protein [Myxococcota bacterium]